jgi:protein gp37
MSLPTFHELLEFYDSSGTKMAQNSKIEWTDHTFNPWVGCTNVSPGCDHCYAEAWSRRSGLVKWGKNPRRRTSESYWRAPSKWQAAAASYEARHGRRQRVFCASLADVFDNQVDPAWRADLFDLIASTPALDWLLLTKRPQNIEKMLPQAWPDGGMSNVWLGATTEDQVRFDQRWQVLSRVPAVVRFISYEPAIGPIRLNRAHDLQPDWLIAGGESGHGARPVRAVWMRDYIEDCEALGVAPFFKQWGTVKNNPLVSERGMTAKAAAVDAYGKGGGLLDGQLYRKFPNPIEFSSKPGLRKAG